MKTCAACYRLFSNDSGFCPIDGQRLVPVAEATPPKHPDDQRVGATLCGGRYLVWRIVADGGMGRVYQALDRQVGRSVALKILHPEVALDEVSLERFRREFEVSASLPHEHIVEVLAFESTEDQSFALVMEYLEGEELRTVLKRDKVLPPERLVRMLSQLALGLAEAHERKVVHRDLKPDNIFLVGTHHGDRVKILDFGSVRDNSEGAKKLTVVGTTIGSPFYMSPEQAQGLLTLDHRADVWSLAAIVFECVTGRVPFSAPTGPMILVAILGKDPARPSEAGKAYGVPASLDPVMEAAFMKDPEARLPSVGLLADRVGQAYGLAGSHRDWAYTPQQELAAKIRAGMQAILAHPQHAPGSAGVARTAADPRGLVAPAAAAAAPAASIVAPADPSPVGGEAFAEDMVMGVPQRLPRWVVPTAAGAAVLICALVALLLAR
ncbi:protein kinase [Sorangium cellulosum]|uniref:Protein kinase n=1 Tax=Sorangium cellulosum TaxID=56 RepID=A0A2L0EV07_SORCE|nr:serine/threonine-protein kinase [Sorangium cellulosum]AUX43123.1 protein kinase [Sorangium cellulosum]